MTNKSNHSILTHQPKSGGLAERAQAKGLNLTYLDGLNPEQKQAVEILEGPLLVLAGAGTGKTRVLTTRIAHILATRSAHPSQILAVTFTNKAAREMKTRITNLISNITEGMPWLGTFHAIGVKLLRRHAELIGLNSNFTILDTDDQIRLLKQIIQADNIDEKRWPAKQLSYIIGNWKNRGLLPSDVPSHDDHGFANGYGPQLYEKYQARLKTLNAVDFGDLLLSCITLFKNHTDILDDYHKRFKFILVDEYQDTNVAQYLWLRLLSQKNHNICCVGDDDQSIYGWRGAEVDNILRFGKDFPGANIIRLERNYRSTGHILAAASGLIAQNEDRLGKTLFTETGHMGTPVKINCVWDSEEEARTIGDDIENLQHQGHKLNNIAILVRASFQMRSFEDRFMTLGLNYRVIGGPRFYERLEIRDAIAYFRTTLQPADDLAFERIVNKPRRGLGDATLNILHSYARQRQISLMQAACEIGQTEELKPKQRKALNQLIMSFARWREQADHLPHTELAEIILEESGYTDMWQNDRSADSPGRLENLKELIRFMGDFESMGGFLEHISLAMDAESNNNQDAINIMTLHSAKGLEFDTVYLPGWEEGLFPHQRVLDENGRIGLEEERRLAYVGLTRARQAAKIWFASNRRIHGLWQSSIPSRFIDELPEAHCEVNDTSTHYGGYNSTPFSSRFKNHDPFQNTYATPGWQRAQKRKKDMQRNQSYQSKHIIDGELIAKSISNDMSKFQLGERVFHIKFGYGHVLQIDGNKLTVDFDKAGRKKVVDQFLEYT